MATDNEIIKALTVLSAAYPNFKLTEDTVKIYIRLLADLDFDLLKASTLQCATTHTFFPSVAELRAAAVELKSMAEGIPSALEAWGNVLSEIRRCGQYMTPEFSHPLTAEVVRQLGYRNLCMSENQSHDRARFMDSYTELLKLKKRKSQMLPEVRDIVEHRLNTGEQMSLLAAKLEA